MTAADTEISTTRSLWALIRSNAATLASFICPSSEDVKNQDDNPQDSWDFKKSEECSYGSQVSFGKKGLPMADCDPRMPLAADKGPFGTAMEKGTPRPSMPTLTLAGFPDEWRPWNSLNHGQEGQTLLFPDGHADFSPKPCAGIKSDNIYTRWASADAGSEANALQRIQGTPPTGNETPWSDTDTLIYP